MGKRPVVRTGHEAREGGRQDSVPPPWTPAHLSRPSLSIPVSVSFRGCGGGGVGCPGS